MKAWTIAPPLIFALSCAAHAEMSDISSVSDATLPPTTERQDMGRGTAPDVDTAKTLQEARRTWDIPWWAPSPAPTLYPMSRAPLGEPATREENSTPSSISR